jgi:adenylosuccinate lyase
MASLQPLLSVSPVDGRYAKQTHNLSQYFSEYALIRYRVLVEIEYFIFLKQQKIINVPNTVINALRKTLQQFSVEDAAAIKDIEKTTNHDVKAVEYFIKNILVKHNAEAYQEWVHFGLTSQDINNTAIPLLIKDSMEELILPALFNMLGIIDRLAAQWQRIPMLAKTHGQAASPTGLGKEFKVFSDRLTGQLVLLMQVPNTAKFGGATGNFNAHAITFPNINWPKFANTFVSTKLGLERLQHTTQIEPYDNIAAWCDGLKRINTILIDFSRDVWQYISMDYFKQKLKEGEVGSSAMPHKVNPIDFENAEGNLGIANALFEHFAAKLPISRLQRDLTDSTVLRNIGVPVAHLYIALQSLEKGISKLVVNQKAIDADLENNWAVVAEAIQTILRKEGVVGAYELLKKATRGKASIGKKEMHAFIKSLKVSEVLKKKLYAITPHNYVGFALKA